MNQGVPGGAKKNSCDKFEGPMIKTLGKFFSQAVCRVRHGDGVIRISINYPTVEPSNEDNNNNNNENKTKGE